MNKNLLLLLFFFLPCVLLAQDVKEELSKLKEIPSWEKLTKQDQGSDAAIVLNHSRSLAKTAAAPLMVELAPFYHGVASGDPLQDRVIIWTRVTPPDDYNESTIEGSYRVCTDPDMLNEVTAGDFSANADKDWTVKIDVEGLEAGTTYFYGFSALEAHSLTGRTKTLPTGNVDHSRIAIVSCSHYQQGFFNAYGRLAEHNDLDFVMHLGDYIYEYGTYSDFLGENDTVFPRPHDPENEILSLSDYRTRHSLYKLDENLRNLHQQYAFINIWDDHETANDSWKGGADNHDPETEGSWEDRKNNGMQAFFEWLPIRQAEGGSTKIYRSFQIGDLADITMIDTRLEGREEQSTDDAVVESEDRTLLGQEQFDWLEDKLVSSTAKWRIVGNQVVFSPVNTLGLPGSEDMWNGYPAERQKLLNVIKDNEIDNLIILTGDFHMALAADVVDQPTTYDPEDPNSISYATEFVVPSITTANVDELSDLIKEILPTLTPEAIPPLVRQFNKNLRYDNLFDHGYYLLDITPEQAQVDYFFVDAILEASDGRKDDLNGGHLMIENGNPRIQFAEAVVADGEGPDRAPAEPPAYVFPGFEETKNVASILTILSAYPNPANTTCDMMYALSEVQQMKVGLYDLEGKLIKQVYQNEQAPGVYTLRLNVESLAAGIYLARFETEKGVVSRRVVVQH